MVQRIGRGIALLFNDRSTRRGWVLSSTPWPYFTLGKDAVPIVQEAGWALGPVWRGGKSRSHRDSIQDLPTRNQSLYRLRYPAQSRSNYFCKIRITFKPACKQARRGAKFFFRFTKVPFVQVHGLWTPDHSNCKTFWPKADFPSWQGSILDRFKCTYYVWVTANVKMI